MENKRLAAVVTGERPNLYELPWWRRPHAGLERVESREAFERHSGRRAEAIELRHPSGRRPLGCGRRRPHAGLERVESREAFERALRGDDALTETFEQALRGDEAPLRGCLAAGRTSTFILTSLLTSGYLLTNFERPVLSCIEAEFCK